MGPRKSRRRRLATAGLLLGSTLSGVLGGEIVFRYLEPEPLLANEAVSDRVREDPALFAPAPPPLGFMPEPGRVAGPGRINALGLRDRDYPDRKPPGTYRILVLGDSITWGSGIDQDATFENLLEDRLVAEGRPVQSLNLGVPGYNAVMMAAYLERRGLPLEPDLVLAVVGLNDESITPVVIWEETQTRFRWYDSTRSHDVPWLWRLPWDLDRWLMRHSALFRGLCRRLASPDAPRFRRHQQENRRALLALAAAARRHGAAAAFVLLPELLDLAPYPRRGEHDDLAGFLAAAGETVIDLLAGLRRATDGRGASLRFHPHDPLHPDQRGNRLIADLLHDELVRRKLVPAPGSAGLR